MLSPTEFHQEYPPDELAGKLPEEPITSLRDLQFLYGKLYTLATAGGGEYAAYLTPDQASDLFGKEDSVIAVQVDLSGDKPRLDPDEPIFVTTYRKELVGEVAHSKFDAARGIDHSVTHRSGQNSSTEKLARYAKERLTRWATDDAVREEADNREGGWVISGLAELGEDDDVTGRIETAVEAKLGGPRTSLLTVRIKLESDKSYRWPGDIDIFQAAMRARKLSKLVSKNAATESAGDATDLVSGERARTVGMAEDPLNYFLGKQMEKFPGLDPDEAWRSHPISEDAAVTLMNAETFVDACTYRRFGANVYYLPYYLGRVTPDRAYRLYGILYRAATSDDEESMTPIEHAYERLEADGRNPRSENRLRFYVAAIQEHQTKRYDVFGDTMNGSILHPSELAAAHAELLDTWAFDPGDTPDGLRPAMPTSEEEWSLLVRVPPENYRRTVSSGAYFYRTFQHGDEDTDATADDFRIVALVSVLAGDPIPVERLLETYVARLREDDGDEFPSFLVASQFAQLCALARADLLAAPDGNDSLAEPPTYTEDMTKHTPTRARADGGESRAVKRDRKLEAFIKETPALRENHERRAAYLLGALVGQVSGYQQSSEGRSTTLVDQYSIDSMTKTRLKRTTHEVLDKDVVYSRENRMSSTMYAEVVDRLREAFTAGGDPDEWQIDTEDLRFYYSLGVTYGLNNWTEDGENEDSQ